MRTQHARQREAVTDLQWAHCKRILPGVAVVENRCRRPPLPNLRQFPHWKGGVSLEFREVTVADREVESAASKQRSVVGTRTGV